MAELEIIGVPFSNYVRAVRMLCEEKCVAYTLTPSRPHSPEVAAIHPAGQVPVMRHGDVALFELKAIATYIDRTFPGPRLLPEDTLVAAKVEQWVSYTNVRVDRWIMREFVVPSVFYDKAKGPDTARIAASLPEIEKCCAALDKAVAGGGYIAGPALTYADLNLATILATFQGYPAGKEIMARHTALTDYVARITARDSYAKTAPPPRK